MIAPRDDSDVGACVWKCRREAIPLTREEHWIGAPIGGVTSGGAAQARERSTPAATVGADGQQRVARVRVRERG